MLSRLPRATLLASVSVGSVVLAAACQKVPLLAPTGSSITLTSSATALPINGSADIIAQVIEAAGTPPHSGTQITFTTNLGTVQPSTAETDTAGRVIVRFTAGTTSGTATITAISGGVSATGDKAIKIQIGAAAVGSVSVNASPATLPSAGGTTTITAIVSDTTGNPLPGVPVTFAIDTGTGSSGAGSLGQTVVTTDSTGRASTTLLTNRTTTVSASAGIGTATGTPPTGGTQTAKVTVVVNATNTIAIGAPSPATPVAGQAVTFPLTYGTAASPITRVTVDWGDGQIQNFTGQPAAISHTYQSQRSYLVVVTGFDALGDSSTSTASVTVNARPALVVTLSANPTQPNTNQVVTFTITATPTSGNAITTVAIDFGDGGRGTLTGNVQTAQHVYTTPATYIVTVVATDSSGATGSSSLPLVVGNFTALSAEFTISPTSGPAATTVFSFNGSDSAPRETIVDYAWDFGDGTSSNGPTSATTHGYAGKAPGTYTVRLTVTDNSGRTATKTHTLTIT